MTDTATDGDNSTLELSLYQNAMDSIRHAIEHYVHDDVEERRYKYAILHLSQGVALLLKERLSREHPSLIFANVVDPDKTADLRTTMRRLESIAHVDLRYARPIIEELAALRNRIEHYSISIGKQQADSTISRAIPFLVAFTRDELRGDLRRELGDQNWQALLATRSYLDGAIRAAEAEIRRRGEDAFICNRCEASTATMVTKVWEPVQGYRFIHSIAVCRVCGMNVLSRTECHRCGAEVRLRIDDPRPVRYPWYCQTCREHLRREFSGFESPEFVAEVRRLFGSRETASADELMALLMHVYYLGPSARPRCLIELYAKGMIDFVYDSEREYYQVTRHIPGVGAAGFRPHALFRWTGGNSTEPEVQ